MTHPKQSEIPALHHTSKTARTPQEKARALNRLGAYYLQTPYPRTANINTAFRLATEAAHLSEKNQLGKDFDHAKSLIAYTYIRRSMADSAIALLPQLSDSSRFHLLLVLSYYLRTNIRGKKDAGLKRAGKMAEEALLIGRKLNDTLKVLQARQELAGVQSEYNDINIDSEKELLTILELYHGIKYTDLQYLYHELCGTALALAQEDKALQYSILALKALEHSKDSAIAGDLFLAHSMILRRKGEPAQAILYMKKAVDAYRFQYGHGSINLALTFIIDQFAKANQASEGDQLITKLFRDYPPDNRRDSLQQLQAMATFYRVTKQYDKAEKYMLMNLAMRNENEQLAPPLRDLGQIYVEAGKFEKAKPYLEKALKLMDANSSIRFKGHLYYCLFLTDSALGNYRSAIRYLTKNKQCDDSLITQSKVDALQKYQTQFETEKKEDSLKFKDQHISLLTRSNILQKENLRQSNLIKNITIGGIILTLIILALLYQQYRSKQQTNKIISRKNSQLEKLVGEKEWLLKEVHHRVKNNLQTVVSLLELQSEYLDNDALSAIQASQSRIYATSLLHQKLYRDDNLSSVNMADYLVELVQYLKEAYDIRHEIAFTMNITPIELDVSQAVPLGLIVNEAITNAYKYAFRSSVQKPEIMLSLTLSEDVADLVIADNGNGFRMKDDSEVSGIGLKLIKGLAEDIDGTAKIRSADGTHILIRFNPKFPLNAGIDQQQVLTA